MTTFNNSSNFNVTPTDTVYVNGTIGSNAQATGRGTSYLPYATPSIAGAAATAGQTVLISPLVAGYTDASFGILPNISYVGINQPRVTTGGNLLLGGGWTGSGLTATLDNVYFQTMSLAFNTFSVTSSTFNLKNTLHNTFFASCVDTTMAFNLNNIKSTGAFEIDGGTVDIHGSTFDSTLIVGCNISSGNTTYISDCEALSFTASVVGSAPCTVYVRSSRIPTITASGTNVIVYVDASSWPATINASGGAQVLPLPQTNIDLKTGGALRTSRSAGNTALLQAYDVDGAAYTTFATLTANNTPTLDLSSAVTQNGTAIVLAGANSNITSLTGITGGISAPTSLVFANGAGRRLQAGSTNGSSLFFDAFNAGSPVTYITFASGTSTSSCTLAGVTINGSSTISSTTLSGVTINSSSTISSSTITSTTLGAADSTQATARYLDVIPSQITNSTTVGVSHFGCYVIINSASAITVTLPQQSTTATVAGVRMRFINIGAGLVTFAKEGSETLIGNTICATNQTIDVNRDTTTQWVTFGGTAVVADIIAGSAVGAIVNQAYDIAVRMPYAGTITGITTKSTTTAVAGTFTVAIAGVSVTGLTTVANGASGVRTNTTASAANTFAIGDYITITFAGATITDMFWALAVTRNL